MQNKLNQLLSFERLLLVAIAVSIVLRIINLGSREFWYDEVLSLLLSNGQKINYQHPGNLPVILADYTALLNLPVENNWTDVLHTGKNLLRGLVAEPHPPLFFLGQHLWLRLFGNSEIAMRSLPMLFSIGAIGCGYGLGRCLLGNRGGLLFAALLGLNPYYLFHSLNVRMYCSLVFWTILSAWSLLEIIKDFNRNYHQIFHQINRSKKRPKKLIWIFIFIAAITGGLLTFYYFTIWLIALGIIVLWLDRRRWWQYGLCLGIAILPVIPWVYWGTRQQLRNADLGRFTNSGSWLEATVRHLQEAINVLGIHLILGDWATILPSVVITLAGIAAIALLIVAAVNLWQDGQYRLLIIVSLLGWMPFLLMVLIDFISGKFTVGFGWGRSVIFILPGCLLLIAAWLSSKGKKWRQNVAIALLILYLIIDITDFQLRSRLMFHQIADIMTENSTAPTLIVLNSPAWGHVLRLAYYLPKTSPVMLLAQQANNVAPALQKTLSSQPNRYQRIIYLESAKPVWGKPSTDEESKQVKQILAKDFQQEKTQFLRGTWKLDNFTLNLYSRERGRVKSEE
jgi:uncharacterized membrane protein